MKTITMRTIARRRRIGKGETHFRASDWIHEILEILVFSEFCLGNQMIELHQSAMNIFRLI
jgi:hypothetical protein